MTTYWTLEVLGVEQSFADWGFVSARRSQSSLNGESFSVDVPGARADSDPLCEYEAVVIIRKGRTRLGAHGAYGGGVIWMTGVRTLCKAMSQNGAEGLRYTFEHAGWYYLKFTPYQQEWFSGQSSDVLLNVDSAGHYMTTGEQMRDVIVWARSCGAPVQAGTIEPGIYVPINEDQDRQCADVLQQQARWTPSGIGFFDDTTAPATFHFRKAEDLKVLTVGLPSDRTRWEITPRPDLVLPAVKLIFKSTGDVDGRKEITLDTQIAPPSATGLALGTLTQTIDLEGPKLSVTRVKVETLALDTGAIDARLPVNDFWKRLMPALQNNQWRNGFVTFLGANDPNGVAVQLNTVGGYILTSGQLTDTMRLTGGGPVLFRKLHLWVKVEADHYTAGGESLGKLEQKLFIEKTVTNAVTNTYVSEGEAEEGEPVSQFDGMANYLWGGRKDLQYEGFVTLTEREVGDFLLARREDGDELRSWIGHRLNLTGGRDEWAAMGATIQNVEENLESGEVTLRFGPVNKRLDVGSIKDLLKNSRRRRRKTSLKARVTGEADSGVAKLGEETGVSGTMGQTTEYKELIIRSAGGYLKLTPTKIEMVALDDKNPPNEISRVEIGTGLTQKVYMLCTDLPANAVVRFNGTGMCDGTTKKSKQVLRES